MGFITSLFSSPKAPAPLAPLKPEKPISPVTDRAFTDATIRKQRRRASLATQATGSLLNEDTGPLGT